MMLCVCGMCIPLYGLIPLFGFIFYPVYNFIMKLLGREVKDVSGLKKKNDDGTCCSSCSAMKPSDYSGGVNLLDSVDEWNTFIDFTNAKRTDNSEDEAVQLLVCFSASWCGPCKKMFPIYAEYANKKPNKVLLVKVDVDEYADKLDLYSTFGIAALPHYSVVTDGKPSASYTGSNEEAFRLFVKNKLDM
eukprot:g1876.t1